MSADSFKYDVFLSYNQKDKKTVHALAERLKKDGLRVWLDAWVLKPGDPVSLKIQHGLEQSRTLLMCMSPAYFSSDWATLEHHTLLFRDPTNAKRRFVPLLLTACMPPDVIGQFLYIDWREPSKQVYAQIIAACDDRAAPVEESAALTARPKDASRILHGHTAEVNGVSVSPDGRMAVSSSDDGTIRVWDVAAGWYTANLNGHVGPIWSVSMSSDGRIAVAGTQDGTVRVWDIMAGRCTAKLRGHTEPVWAVSTSTDGRIAVSGADDGTVRVWDVAAGTCTAKLEGHSGRVRGVAVSADGRIAVSGADDGTVRVWDVAAGTCTAKLEGHSGRVRGVAVSADGRIAVSGSADKTVRVWDLVARRCSGLLEGHTNMVRSVSISADGRTVVSGSADRTVRVWDLVNGSCSATFRGHTDRVIGVSISADGRMAVSGSADRTVRVWELPINDSRSNADRSSRYTNAKVVLVGASGVGKSGLRLRLCERRWEATESTHGMVVSPFPLPPSPDSDGIDREVWLWDFAGQPDYRLVHQLYMDETALGVVVFDPQDDNPFEEIAYWEKALHAAAKHVPAKLLVAARCDRGGITISRKRFDQFIKQKGFASEIIITGAKTGKGCDDLETAIAKHIPWDRLPWTSTTTLFKTLKDAIIKLTEENAPLARLPELHQRLQLLLPKEAIGEQDLRTVIGLLQGQGVVQALSFGDFVLLRPEWINRYASVVVRMAREHADEMGVVPEQQVLDGRLDYKEMERLSEADEKILLRAMVQTLLDYSLCIRQETPKGTMLVFPSYFRRDKPDQPDHPSVFVTYGFSGPPDEIYSTLVVRLSYSGDFSVDQLWKDAADFKTHAGRRVGLAMHKKAEGTAEIVIYFEPGVPDDTQVTFIKYVHEHLLARAHPRESVTRVRAYVCPNKKCGEPVESMRAIKKALERKAKSIPCQFCGKPIPLFDLIEQKFASSDALAKVREMDEHARISLDNQSLELILVGHATSIAAEAGQIFRPVAWADWGIDGEIEFKNDRGQASGKRVYLQLKSGDSYLRPRKRDEAEVFNIKPRHAEYWLAQAYDVMLVIRTSDGRIRWMNVTEYLKRHGKDVKQITFDGEPFTAPHVAKLRDKLVT